MTVPTLLDRNDRRRVAPFDCYKIPKHAEDVFVAVITKRTQFSHFESKTSRCFVLSARIVNQIKAILTRFGIRTFRPSSMRPSAAMSNSAWHAPRGSLQRLGGEAKDNGAAYGE
jgi:hypothetical protein